MPTIEEFGRTIKQKYPQYQNIDDKELGLKMIEKYPQYKDRIFDTDPQTQEQIAQPQGEQPTQGVWDAVKKGASNFKETIKKTGEELANTWATPTTSPLGDFTKAVKMTVGPMAGMLQAGIAEPISTGMRVSGELIQKATGYDINEETSKGVQKLVQAGIDTDVAKKTMEGYQKYVASNPESQLAASAIGDIAEIITYVIGGKTVNKAGTGLTKAGKEITNMGSNFAQSGVVKGTGKAVSKAGTYATGQAYGFSPQTVKTIIKNPNLFTAKEMAKIDRDSIFTKVKNAVMQRKNELSSTGKEYQGIKSLPIKTNVSENTIKTLLKNRGIDVVDGKIKVSLASDIQLSKADINGLQEVLSLVKGKQTLTPKEILNLRTRLSNLSKFGEGKTDASKLVAKEIRANIDDIAKREIPGLAELDAKFGPEKQMLSKIESAIWNKDKTIKDNALSSIANLNKKGKELALERMEKVIPGLREDLNILSAIEDIAHTGGQKVGTYTRTALGAGGGMLAGGPFGLVAGVIASSPQAGVALIRTYAKAKGIAKNFVNNTIGKMKSGTKLAGKEKQLIDDAINNAANNISKRAKNVKINPGLTIEDVSKQTGKQVYQGKGGLADKMINGVDELGAGTYVAKDVETASKFGSVSKIKSNLKPSEILNIKSQKDFEAFTKNAIRQFPDLDVAKAKTAYAKSQGYKAISASKEFDPLGGINVIDKSVLKSQSLEGAKEFQAAIDKKWITHWNVASDVQKNKILKIAREFDYFNDFKAKYSKAPTEFLKKIFIKSRKL